MGRDTNDVEDRVPEGEGPDRYRGVRKVPLLPAVSGIVAISAVMFAISTQQISLNFAGGAPPPGLRAQPQTGDSAQPDGRHRTRDDSSMPPHVAGRASRGASRAAVTVAFHTLSTSRAGYLEQMTITNRGAEPVTGWMLTLSYPRTKILSTWNGKITREGDSVIFRNPTAHPSIGPGRSVKVMFTADGASAEPFACSFNGRSC